MKDRSDHHDVLRLVPLRPEDYDCVQALLNTPRLCKRRLYSGIHELHPTEWTRVRKTFVIWEQDRLLGTTELHADEDEPGHWELNVTVDHVEEKQYAARCAIAGLFYAFEVLGARSVWFWNERDNGRMHRFAEKTGFTRLNELMVPGGGVADVFELDGRCWETETVNRFADYLNRPIEICDSSGAWRGEGAAFFVLTED